MIKKLEHIINNSPLYNFLRFNIFSDKFIELLQKKTQKNVTYYSSFLHSGSGVIFDIGANKGNKVKAFLKMGYKVIAVEPESSAAETMRFRYGNNKNVTIITKAVSDKEDDSKLLRIHDARSGFNTFSDKWIASLGNKDRHNGKSYEFKRSCVVHTTTVESLINAYGVPHFIKIDVEGHEINVIKGIKQLPDYLSFELNLPEFINEGKEIINFLSNLNSNIKYQYSFNDKLEAGNWLSKNEMLKILNSTGKNYMEIICSVTIPSTMPCQSQTCTSHHLLTGAHTLH